MTTKADKEIMTTTILTDDELRSIQAQHLNTIGHRDARIASVIKAARAIEQAVLQSEQVQEWKRDAERLDWLADPNNSIGNVQLPTECVAENLHSLRAAIDDAMEKQP